MPPVPVTATLTVGRFGSFEEIVNVCEATPALVGLNRMVDVVLEPAGTESVDGVAEKAPLRVIIGNPPYSVGQKSANDNAQNQSYEKLDSRIAKTYAALTDATNKNSLYDSYIKAFRWSADRLDKSGGIICFVSNVFA